MSRWLYFFGAIIALIVVVFAMTWNPSAVKSMETKALAPDEVHVIYVIDDNGKVTDVRPGNGKPVVEPDVGPHKGVITDQMVLLISKENPTCTWHYINGRWVKICS